MKEESEDKMVRHEEDRRKTKESKSSSGRSSMPRCRNSDATTTSDDQPHIGNYRLLKTIGKGNFAKVKLARHVLTGKE
ncbi:serine/threonine-protein kinase MARK2 isoform X1, partial [Lates japonicus]